MTARKHFTARLPVTLAIALAQQAETNHRSANAELVAILQREFSPRMFERPVSGTPSTQLVGAAVFTHSGAVVVKLDDQGVEVQRHVETEVDKRIVSAMARTMSDRNADACNVDREDYWKTYGQDYIEDVQAMVDSVRT